MRKNIFVVGPSNSVLIRQRVDMLSSLDTELYWYSQSDYKVEGIKTYHRLSSVRALGSLIELFYVFFLLCWIRPAYVHVFFAKNRWLNCILAIHPRLIVTVMGSDISDATVPAESVDFRLVKLLLNRASVITSKSFYMDEILKRFNVNDKKIYRITWGIDIDKFRLDLDCAPLKKQLNITPGVNVFFSLRGCRPLYQHEKVINAFARFLSVHPDSVLLVSTMGAESNYLDQLQQQAKVLELGKKIHFLPEISSDEMPYYYNLADAVVSVPISDGMPQSIYESMACGCFHVLGDLPQYYEIIKAEENGVFVDLNDWNELEKAFSWVVENKNLIKLLGERNRESIISLVDSFKQKEKLAELYQCLDGNVVSG